MESAENLANKTSDELLGLLDARGGEAQSERGESERARVIEEITKRLNTPR